MEFVSISLSSCRFLRKDSAREICCSVVSMRVVGSFSDTHHGAHLGGILPFVLGNYRPISILTSINNLRM
jgi:hypothetical protein